VVGKLASRWTVGVLQMTVLFAVGFALFRVSLGPQPWALLLPILGIVFAGTALGLVAAAIAPSRDAVVPVGSIAILTMAVGSLFALTQTDIKRMLAYSSIAHAGFLLVGFVGLQQAGEDGGVSSLQSVLFYLVTYGFMTLGAFGVVTLVRDAGGEANHLSRWAGLGKESPLVAGVFAFFLLAMAGIPLTSGFTGKWVVFTSMGAANPNLWRVPIDGGEPVKLSDKFSVSPAVSPDGKHIACYYWDERPETQLVIALIPFEGGSPVKTFNLPSPNVRWMGRAGA
jgi:hypothetical protein